MSPITKKYKKLKNFYGFLSFLFTIFPLVFYTIKGFADGDITSGRKVFLGFTLVMAIILVLFNILCKFHLRSPLFLILLGIYFALDKIMVLLVIISIGVMLDEFIFSPLKTRYKEKYKINLEIDKRG